MSFKNKSTNFLLLILIISFIGFSLEKNDFDLLLEWGKNYSLEISKKIGMNYISENNKTFYVKEDISKNEVILRIPSEIYFSINTALDYLGKKTKKQYEQYKNHNFGISNDFVKIRIQQSFLAYLMMTTNKNASKKNKLYQFYKYFFNTFESNLDNFPAFYTAEQFNLLRVSVFANDILQMHQVYEEEYMILKNEIVKKDLNFDEYLKYRTLSISKSHNVSHVNTLVPFLDMFQRKPNKFNLNYTFEEWGVSVYATRKIKKNRKLFLRIEPYSNSNSLLLYGMTFEESNNVVDSFNIPIISSIFLQDKGIDQKFAKANHLNLVNKKFYEEMMPTYLKFSKDIKEDGSKLSALRLFLGNLQSLRNNYDKVTTSDIHKFFFTSRDIENVKRILSTETRFYDEKIGIIKTLINYTEHNSTEAENIPEDINLDL